MKSRYQIESTLRTTGIPGEERMMIATYLFRDTRDNKVLREESVSLKISKEDIRTDNEMIQSGILERILGYALSLVKQDKKENT